MKLKYIRYIGDVIHFNLNRIFLLLIFCLSGINVYTDSFENKFTISDLDLASKEAEIVQNSIAGNILEVDASGNLRLGFFSQFFVIST